MDGGLGLVLENDGNGNLVPMTARESGLVIPEDARSLAITDLNGDQRPDLVFGINDGQTITYLNQSKAETLVVPLSPSDLGMRVTLNGMTRELTGGGSYLAQSSPVLVFPKPSEKTTVEIRRPNGSIETVEVESDATILNLPR